MDKINMETRAVKTASTVVKNDFMSKGILLLGTNLGDKYRNLRLAMDHLRELRELLRPGGQLVLETLVIDGPEGQVLVPEGRYGKMPNVWFLPSPETLVSWMRKQGFVNPRVVDISATSIEEQRSTEWMTYDSLVDFLDPKDINKTAEGHPAPIRAVVVAEVPFQLTNDTLRPLEPRLQAHKNNQERWQQLCMSQIPYEHLSHSVNWRS